MKKVRKILLIDDDEVTCYINKLFLEGMKVAEEIDCVHDGLAGLQYLHKHCLEGSLPELIFLDNKMPVMNGFEFLEALGEMENIDISCFYIVMLTTSLDIKDVQRAANFGDMLHAYITKPLEIKKLKQVLAILPEQ